MVVRIRRGGVTDASAVAELAAITFPLAAPDDTDPAAIAEFVRTTLGADRFTGYLADPAREVLLAEGPHPSAGPDALVGYAMLIRGDPVDPDVVAAVTTRPTVDLNKFYVHADHHGSGTASALMTAVIATARSGGARSLWLGVNNQNARANRFYEKHGFAIVGTKRFKLGDRYEHDFVRELRLP